MARGRPKSPERTRQQERAALDAEHVRERRQGPPPVPRAPFPIPTAPAWMREHVVDPAWCKTFSMAKAEDIPEPFSMLGNAQVEQLKLAFDPAIFSDEKGMTIRKLGTKSPDAPAVEVLDAVTEFLESVREAANTTPTLMDVPENLLRACYKDAVRLVNHMRSAAIDALQLADDAIDQTMFIRGIFEHHIDPMEMHSDIAPEELIRSGLHNIDTIDRTLLLDNLRMEGIIP